MGHLQRPSLNFVAFFQSGMVGGHGRGDGRDGREGMVGGMVGDTPPSAENCVNSLDARPVAGGWA